MKNILVIVWILGITPVASLGMLKSKNKKKLSDGPELKWQDNLEKPRAPRINELDEAKLHRSGCVCDPCLRNSIAALQVIMDQKKAMENRKDNQTNQLYEDLAIAVALAHKTYKYKGYGVCKARSDSHILRRKNEATSSETYKDGNTGESIYGDSETQKTLSASESLVWLKKGKWKDFDKN
jgi:hypothetical protein